MHFCFCKVHACMHAGRHTFPDCSLSLSRCCVAAWVSPCRCCCCCCCWCCCCRLSPALKLEPVPEELWRGYRPPVAAGDCESLLNVAERSLVLLSKELGLEGNLIRKQRAVGLVPRDDATNREAFFLLAFHLYRVFLLWTCCCFFCLLGDTPWWGCPSVNHSSVKCVHAFVVKWYRWCCSSLLLLLLLLQRFGLAALITRACTRRHWMRAS